MGSVFTAMNYIILKENRTPEEQKMYEGFTYTCRLMLEHERFRVSVYNHVNFNVYEPFPMSTFLRKRFLDTISVFLREKFVPDIIKALGIPDKTEQQLIDERLREQKAIDFDALFQKDRKAVVKVIEDKGETILVRRDLTSKDDQLIRKMNFLADSLEIKKPPKIELDFGESNVENAIKLKEQMTYDIKAAQLTTENLVKVLYLNNSDPQQFNTEYWAEVLNITPQKLKNVFYNFSVPILAEDNEGSAAQYKLEYEEVEHKVRREPKRGG
mmetsp:Transcript_29026/g.51914  ORF Transcript_29026/g.51914 Transcript_29026/m.51914 type:complete len:270 (-) Transcript_29026:77-886(-)